MVSGTLFGIYIDDLCALAILPWSGLRALPSDAELLCQRADATYAAEGWPRSAAKDQCDTDAWKMWGICIEGRKGKVGISREHRMQLATLTLRYLHIHWFGRDFASLIGLWCSVLQLRRPGYSVLDACFSVFPSNALDQSKHLPQSAKVELFIS